MKSKDYERVRITVTLDFLQDDQIDTSEEFLYADVQVRSDKKQKLS